jgi:hypothetical protein
VQISSAPSIHAAGWATRHRRKAQRATTEQLGRISVTTCPAAAWRVPRAPERSATRRARSRASFQVAGCRADRASGASTNEEATTRAT